MQCLIQYFTTVLKNNMQCVAIRVQSFCNVAKCYERYFSNRCLLQAKKESNLSSLSQPHYNLNSTKNKTTMQVR
jgi:hypothetical protein